MRGEFAYHVEFSRNVFFNGVKYYISSMNYSDWDIMNNVFLALKKRVLPPVKVEIESVYDATAAIYMYGPYDADVDSITVTGNAMQGSDSIGYAFPNTNCLQKAKNGFYNNEAGYAQVAVIINH